MGNRGALQILAFPGVKHSIVNENRNYQSTGVVQPHFDGH